MKAAPKPRGRPRGSRNKKTIIRDALAATWGDGEISFWMAVCEQAKKGCTQSQGLLAGRLVPVLKPSSEVVQLPPSKRLTGTSAEMARQIIGLVSDGTVAPSTAQELLQSVAAMVSIETGADLLARIELLEEGQPV